MLSASARARVDQAITRIASIDFSGVRLKLADPLEGLALGEEELDHAEREYRRFLALTMAYPERTIVPTREVDDFWHQHILDTRAYAEDTERVFGFFLHHYPYLGKRGPDDAELLHRSFADTQELMALHFGGEGEQLAASASCHSARSCSNCSRGR